MARRMLAIVTVVATTTDIGGSRNRKDGLFAGKSFGDWARKHSQRREGREPQSGGVDAATGETSLLAVSPSCGLRFFSGALTDLVAEIRNLIGDVGSGFLTAGRCD